MKEIKKVVGVRLEPSILKVLEKEAGKAGMSISEYIRGLIKKEIKK